MGANGSKSVPRRTKTTISGRSTSSSQKPSTDNDIHRLAIDPSAVIGSLYNARRDCLMENAMREFPSLPVTVIKLTPDPKIHIDKLKGKNLPDIIGIDKELCLSVYLNVVASFGIPLLIKYPFMIDEHTRFLSFYYPTERSYCSDEQTTITSKGLRKSIADSNTTHVVTEIQTGIHIVIVLQLSRKHESDLDHLLVKIKNQLTMNTFNIEPNDEHLFNQFTGTNVFSNISDVAKMTKLIDVCRELIEIKSDVSQHGPLEYTLRPIESFFRSYSTDKDKYTSLSPENMKQLEQYLNPLSLARKTLKILLSSKLEQSLKNHFKQQFDDVQQQRGRLESMYQSTIKKLSHFVLDIRSGNSRPDIIIRSIIDESDIALLNEIRNVTDRLIALKEKVQIIDDCKQHKIKYFNTENLPLQQDDTLQTIEQKLLNNNKRKRIYCFDDNVNNPTSLQWSDFWKQLVNERKHNPQLDFVYADFSYCSCRIPQMAIWSLKKTTDRTKLLSDAANPSSPERKRSDHSNSSSVNFINVLLLGESGVGKSTFINAIVNYLTFETLEQADSGEPKALMPVSFLMTTGSHFEERIVRFGGVHPNEDHNHPGQSVTQHCRSYVLNIDDRTKLRLIDTPGMGDTRGLDQDDLNMQRILLFINNLSHLNAICVLLKPNESRLNVVFRSYFTRLLGFLGENVRNNIIFCFTNTRATFFAPGNTGPLLRKMLDSHSIKNIPFKKANTFCFDSESFRYLIARKDGIEFDDYQKEEYKRSWISSANESKRLLQCIRENVKLYSQDEWQSIEHAQFQTNQLIRPMLETLRNNLRNYLLLKNNLSKSLIKLRPSPVSRNLTKCIGCNRSSVLLCEFVIIVDQPHVFSNQCQKCTCTFAQHIQLDYILEYGIFDNKRKQSVNETKSNSDQLKQLIKDFVYFFNYHVRISMENDPILSSLKRIIAEEKTIRSRKGTNSLNSSLYDEFNNFKKEYEETWTSSNAKQKPFNLSDTYRLITHVNENKTINEQISAIKQTQKEYMKDYEKQV